MSALLQGTLDLLVLQTLRLGPAHGHTIMQGIKRSSEVESVRTMTSLASCSIVISLGAPTL